MTFTAEEVESLLRDETTVNQYLGYGENGQWTDNDYPVLDDGWTEIGRSRVLVNDDWYEIEIVEETGGMDEGSSASVTFKFGDQYFKKEGYYQSHYGYDWDGDFYEVEPVRVKVTKYKRKA